MKRKLEVVYEPNLICFPVNVLLTILKCFTTVADVRNLAITFITSFEKQFQSVVSKLGLFEGNEMKVAVEIFRTHKTGYLKQQELALNGITYLEVSTEKQESLEGNSSFVECCEASVCHECKYLIGVRKQLKILQTCLFQDINLLRNVIAIPAGTDLFNKMWNLYDKLLPSNDLILSTINKSKEKNDNINNYLIDNDSIVAGSFGCYIAQTYFNNILGEKSPEWTYNDIDIWKYNENGLGTFEDGIPYDIQVPSDRNHVVLKEELKLNYISTVYAKNISDLLYSFDIPCVQVGYSYKTKMFHMTPFAMFAYITKINYITFFDPSETSIYLQYVFDIKSVKTNIVADTRQFEQVDDCRCDLKHPILFNVMDNLQKFNIIKNDVTKLQLNYHRSILDVKINFKNVDLFDFDSQFDKWLSAKKGILVLTTKIPDLFWYFMDEIRGRRLNIANIYHELTNDETKSIMKLSGVKEEIYEDCMGNSSYDLDNDNNSGCF